jgi:hypothetical protein
VALEEVGCRTEGRRLRRARAFPGERPDDFPNLAPNHRSRRARAGLDIHSTAATTTSTTTTTSAASTTPMLRNPSSKASYRAFHCDRPLRERVRAGSVRVSLGPPRGAGTGPDSKGRDWVRNSAGSRSWLNADETTRVRKIGPLGPPRGAGTGPDYVRGPELGRNWAGGRSSARALAPEPGPNLARARPPLNVFFRFLAPATTQCLRWQRGRLRFLNKTSRGDRVRGRARGQDRKHISC